jgi:hypothetical protein
LTPLQKQPSFMSQSDVEQPHVSAPPHDEGVIWQTYEVAGVATQQPPSSIVPFGHVPPIPGG